MRAPTMDLSIYGLDRFGPDDVATDPFPHIFVPGSAVAESTYQYLYDRYPPLDFFLAGRTFEGNHKIHCTGERAKTGKDLDLCWGELVRNIERSDVFDQLMRIFGPWVEKEFPELAARARRGDLTLSTRSDRQPADVNIEQQVSLHTPVSGAPRAERGPHLKTCTKLFVCMLFVPEEPTVVGGGDFVACRRRPGHTPSFGKGQAIGADDVEEVDRLPYTRNSMLIVMNSPRSIVYNVPREPGPQAFRYTHVVVESRTPLFDIPRAPGHDATWRRLARPVREIWRNITGNHPGYVP